MPLPWFRFYHEFSTDPKVQMMPEHYQRRYVMLLCMRCSNGDVTLHDEEIAFHLRIGESDWEETKAYFVSKNLLKKDNSITNWDKRQQMSDSSAERVRRYRESKKALQKQECNATVTAQKENKKENKKEYMFDEFYALYPRKEAIGKAEPAYKKAIKEGATHEEIIRGLKSYNERIRREGTERKYIALPASWLNAKQWKDEYEAEKPKVSNNRQSYDRKAELFG